MKPRTTAIWLLVLAGLGAFVWFYEIRGGEARREAEERSKDLFAEVEVDDIDWIELETRDGKEARLERRDGRWWIVSPVEFPADEGTADAIASALADLRVDRRIEEPQPLAVYGLGEEARRVRFGGGERSFALVIGDRAPVGSATYVTAEPGGGVATVAGYRVGALSRNLDDLREKRPLRFDRSLARRIRLESPAGSVVLVRTEEGWQLEEPVRERADEDTVSRLLSELTFLRASEGVDEAPEGGGGLETPWLRVELTLDPEEEGGEPVTRELVVGAAEGGTRLARGSAGALYRLKQESLDRIPTDPMEYRFRELARFSIPEAHRIEIHFEEPISAPDRVLDVTLERDGEGGWKATGAHLAEEKIDELLGELALLRADRIVAEAVGDEELAALGLDPPRARYRVLGQDGGVLADVRLGALDAEGVYAMRAGESRIFLLPPEVAEHLPANLEAFRNRFEEPAPEPVEEASEPEAEPGAPSTPAQETEEGEEAGARP